MQKEKGTQLEIYGRFVRRKRAALIIAALAAIVAAVFSAGVGSISISAWEIVKTIFGAGDPQQNTVIWGIRLPRVTAAILVGAMLASSGAIMQCVLHNPLASASTLGVSQGAAFGAAVGIMCSAAAL